MELAAVADSTGAIAVIETSGKTGENVEFLFEMVPPYYSGCSLTTVSELSQMSNPQFDRSLTFILISARVHDY